MGNAGPTPSITLEATAAVFAGLSQPGTPLTATEVADELGCTRRTAHRKLEQLVERGELQTKKTGAAGRVWWRPIDVEESTESDDDRARLQQFGEFVRAVEGYAIFMLGPDGAVTCWNEGAKRITGYDEDEIIGEPVSIFYTEEDIERGVPTQNLESAVEDGRIETEGWRVRKDDSTFRANTVITAIHDEEGDLKGFTKVTRDLSTQSDRTREATEHRYRSLVENFPDGAVTLFDEDLRYIAAGGENIERQGQMADDLVGRRISEAGPDELVEQLAPKYRAVIEAGDRRTFDAEYDGRHYRFRALPVLDDAGTVIAGMGVSQDVTERKERERELERYRAAVETARDGVGVWDADGTYRLVNEAFAEGVGLPQDDIIGQPVGMLVDRGLVDESVIEKGAEKTTELLLSDEEQVQFEATIESPVHGEMIVEANLSLLPPESDDQLVGGGVAIIRPITERKRLEDRLSRTVEQLEESNDRLEQFAYVASHDLQEPLRMISSYLQLLERRYASDLDEDGREFIEFAVDGADRMRAMIEDLLAYSRVDTEADPLEPTDCEEVVERVLKSLQTQTEENDAKISVEPLPTVTADRYQLEQVFQNLISNAIKYRGDSSPAVEIGADDEGDEFVFRVADNGIGIDPEHTDRIFDVFARLHTREEYSGTGIGLALCKKIVQRHGGDIWVESTQGEGSTFYFTIPTSED